MSITNNENNDNSYHNNNNDNSKRLHVPRDSSHLEYLRKSGLVIVANRTILSEGSEDFYQLAADLDERGCFVPEGCF